MQRPNIVLILIDDMGWKDLACCGSSFYETPNIDRLAIEGMRFTNAYASCPVCSPTRASLLTGKYPARVGVTNFIGGRAQGKLIDAPYIDHLPLEEFSLARALQQGGYQTWHVGKWHLGEDPYHPEEHGFDVNVAGCSWGRPSNGYFSPWGIPKLEDGPKGEYLTDRLTSEALRLLENKDQRPFFLNLCYYQVHTPLQAKPEKVDKYREKIRALGLDKVKTFEQGEFFPCSHKRDQRVLRRLLQSDPVYAGMVESLDENVGRILEALRTMGEVENTIVIFTSDNGGLATSEGSPTCNAPLAEGKGWMYEGGTREPLLIRWPGVVTPNATCDGPITSPDFYPTLLEAAGLDPIPTQHCDGVSFMPLLSGEKNFDRGPMFWHFPHYGNQGGAPGSSIRVGDYKLIEFFEDNRVELYNLATDIGEEHDLAHEEKDRAEKMRAILTEWRENVGAIIPQPNPECPPA